MASLMEALLRANLVAAATIVAVLVLRRPIRWRFGPDVAYRLWAAPPLAAAATLTPLRTGVAAISPLAHLAPPQMATPVVILWLAGFAVATAGLWRAQAAFLRRAKAGRAGPAVVGVLAPRIVMPPDDGRYSPEERALIRAHEREHILRQDPRAGALMAAFQCLAWFNPLVHLAAHAARLDQELACDAGVLRRHPRARALYARTLLKTQLAGAPLPLGCYWPARSLHPLEVRVALLRRPAHGDGIAGPLLVGLGVLTAAVLAWSVEPPLARTARPAPIAAEPYENGHMSVMLVTWRAPARR